MALNQDQTFEISLKGKVVLITGGYGYLGKGIVDSLLYHGAKVYVLGRDEKKFYKTFPNSDYGDQKVSFEKCDVSSSKSVKNCFDSIYSSEQKINCLINNAFFLKGQSPERMSEDDFLFGLDGTLNSVFRCIKEILPYLKAQKFGKIINVSSMYGMVAPDFEVYDDSPEYLNPPHYGAAKAGVAQLTRYYASYAGRWNVNVNTVVPGAFPSEQVQQNKTFIDALKKRTVLGRIGVQKDIGGIFVFLASDASNYVTGQNLIMDGGWTIR